MERYAVIQRGGASYLACRLFTDYSRYLLGTRLPIGRCPISTEQRLSRNFATTLVQMRNTLTQSLYNVKYAAQHNVRLRDC